ncbi:MAG: hypothetical protein IJR00_03105 [Lachnospiraceae bacterium]|nr:hypothetical protein [Lachnospiraceae bacterium]
MRMQLSGKRTDGAGNRGARQHVICAVLVLLFFFFWMILDGPHIGADSRGYISFGVTREPVYPLFLALCRHLPFASALQAEGYAGIWHAVFFQNLLWSYAVYRTGDFVYRLSGQWKGIAERGRVALMWAAIGFQLAVCLINRLLADRHTMYANLIYTEALTMPLFLLFVIRLWELLREESRKNLLLCAVTAFLLVGTRKQMLMVLIVWGLMTLLYRVLLKAGRNIKTALLHFAVIIAVLLGFRLADACYHAVVHGFFGNVSNREALLCCMLYTADETDASLFGEGEEKEKEWFLAIVKEQERRGAYYDAPEADGGIAARAFHFGTHYDVIGYEIVRPLLYADPEIASIEDDTQRTLQMHESEGALAGILLRQNLTDYFRLFGVNLVSGLAYSVARMSARLLPFVALLYLIYIALLLLLLRKRENPEENRGILLFAVIVLCSIAVNSVVTGALIFPQGRYMIYSMGFFYTALMLMAVTLRRGWHRNE